jgi:hypothetical protein
VGEEYARGQKETPGTILPQGVFLSGYTGWYPTFGGETCAFTLEVRLPPGWEAVSQGRRLTGEETPAGRTVRWESDAPQDEIYLVAGPLTLYREEREGISAQVYLREADPALAARYLEATFRGVSLYSGLIGPYPYAKFAAVENFWETGYGMPSFTLLGPQVIRLPFIPTTSYPHEILHNWWGNGVRVGGGDGNWSEGLTAYLSDHLAKEQQGAGAESRLTTLQKYADYVLSERDLPLSAFGARHGSVSEAVGYGKASMLFHMLRREMGDEAFLRGLASFWREFRFRSASTRDLLGVLGREGGRDLASFFRRWWAEPGAPSLEAAAAAEAGEGGGHLLRLTLRQGQEGEPYPLRVPVAVTLAGETRARQTTVEVTGREATALLALPARPLRVDVDPEYDLFRRLSPGEIPPAISGALGAARAVAILPRRTGGADLERWRALARALAGSGPGEVATLPDGDLAALPADRAVFILGWENRFLAPALEALAATGFTVQGESVRLGASSTPRAGHSFVAAGRLPGDPGQPLLLILADDTRALPGLGRKLPHYHKYGHLAFQGQEPANVVKGRGEVTSSPLTIFLDRRPGEPLPPAGKLAPRSPLAPAPSPFSPDRMQETVRFLADPSLEGRGFGSPGSARAAEHLAGQLAAAGVRPDGDGGGFLQSFPARGGDPPGEAVLRNVAGVIPGTDDTLRGAPVVVGAHHDGLGRGWPDAREGNAGLIHPGADDNASGVAVLLELARVLAAAPPPRRSIRLVLFDGEEAGKLGSRHYLDQLRRRGMEPAAMLNLDTVGGMAGNRLLVLGGGTAREWPHIFRGAGYVTGVDVQLVADPLDASDDGTFAREGVPAVQLFTGPAPTYHRPADTPGSLNAEGLVRVAAVAREAVEYLAGRAEPLTPPGTAPAPQGGGPPGARKTSLGTVPDFAFPGPGMRLAGTVPGSPAEGAGLREGDVVTAVDGRPVATLRDFAEILASRAPGDRVAVTYRRGETVGEVRAVLQAR